jgi:hypothetical protein
MQLLLAFICLVDSIVFTRSEYPYFSQVDKTDQKKTTLTKQISAKPQLLVTFDTKTERMIKEYIWIDHG